MSEQGGTRRLAGGKYELLEFVGQGGMAEVWRALMHGAAGFNRPVAIKRILPTLSAVPDFVAMFVEEARVGSQLLHPNIAQVYDFDQERGEYFLVLEWIEGLDLRRYLSTYSELGQRSPWPLVAAIAVETLRGLGAAHERIDLQGRRSPVIHRDVTPQNILISTNGIAKLTDFGLARAMDRARITSPGVVKGKLAYLAPELTRGEPPSVESDIFSLGVVLWEALAGRLLYEGPTDVDVFERARAADVPPLGEIRDDLPDPLVAAVVRALAPRAEERFSSAREFLRAITRVLREHHQSTDAYALSQSIFEARCILGMPPPSIATPPSVTITIEEARAVPPTPPEALGDDDLLEA